MLTDTHCHLGHHRFTDDLELVLQRATAAQVTRCVAPATDIPNARLLLELSRKYPQIHPAIGIHPCDVDSVFCTDFDWMAELRELAMQPGVAAIGEIGLDYFHKAPEGFTEESWQEQQQRVLTAQLDLAVELGLNAIIHTRESHDAMVRPSAPTRASFVPCFTASEGTWRRRWNSTKWAISYPSPELLPSRIHLSCKPQRETCHWALLC